MHPAPTANILFLELTSWQEIYCYSTKIIRGALITIFLSDPDCRFCKPSNLSIPIFTILEVAYTHILRTFLLLIENLGYNISTYPPRLISDCGLTPNASRSLC